MKKAGVLKGALILSVGGLLAKVFSAFYRIVLTRILGGVGIGLYQLVFPFYSLCVVLASAGIPMAVSKIIAKYRNQEVAILKKCIAYTSFISLVLAFILLISSKGLVILQSEPQIYICYVILAPSVLIVGAASVLRGYFQGKYNFTPSSVSSVVEQFVKMVFGLILSLLLIKHSLLFGVVGAILSIVIGEVVSLIILIVCLKHNKAQGKSSTSLTYKEIGKEIIPITLTNIILPLATFVDSVLVVNLLSINYSGGIPVFLYGLESGAVNSLVSLPTVFSFAIASVVMPNLASKLSSGKEFKLNLALKIVLIISVPCCIVFIVFPKEIIELLYSTSVNSLGIDGGDISSRLLAFSALGVVFLSVNQIISSALQASDKSKVTIRNLIIAVMVKFVIEILLMPNKILNIYSLAVSNIACYLTVMWLNVLELKFSYSLNVDICFIIKIVSSGIVATLAGVWLLKISSSMLFVCASFVLMVLIYFACLLNLKILNRRDIAWLKFKK